MIITIVLAVLCLILVIMLRHERQQSTKKTNFLLDAISAGDYSFKFLEKQRIGDSILRLGGSSSREIGMNAALNRITRIMQDARTEALEREKYYELIINQVNTGIIVVDEKGNILQSNHEALRLLGMEILTHTKQLSRIGEQIEKVISTIQPGEKSHATFLNERGNVELSIRASSATIKGKQVRIIALNDINSEMDDNQMESWNKLIRVLTHEIMNTVTPITSLSETLLGKIADGEVKDGLEVIHTTSAGLTAFVENYRRLTHIPTPQPSLFYVKQFAERMRHIAQEQTGAQNIDISIATEPLDLLVYADEGLIGHVVTNLFKNAIQAITTSGEGSHIWLHAYSNQDDAVVIDIANDGPLIPQDVAEHIFVPFFTTKEKGSGIGLSISRQIMKLSGGTLTLKSDSTHRRTTFSLTFL